MLDSDEQIISEEFVALTVTPAEIDSLWADGWRHFGTQFFRYNIGFLDLDVRRVIPLRIRLADLSFTKSQRRTLRKNEDLVCEIIPVNIDLACEMLFHRHKRRFDHAIPNSIFDFVSQDPQCPCEAFQLSVYEDGRLLAASFFDVGETAVSGIYAIFEPTETARGLGIFTLLKEIEFARANGKKLYYLGYCYEGESFYDYKKRFRATEAFDWKGSWNALGEMAKEVDAGEY